MSDPGPPSQCLSPGPHKVRLGRLRELALEQGQGGGSQVTCGDGGPRVKNLSSRMWGDRKRWGQGKPSIYSKIKLL